MVIDNNVKEEYIYQKKDFLQLGIKEGSFYKLMNDLQLNSPEFRQIKILKNGLSVNTYNQEAMNIVVNYIRSKKESSNKNELALVQKNKELELENQKLQNTLTLMESQYSKQISELKIEKLEETKKAQILESKIETKDIEITFLRENSKSLKEELDKLRNRGLLARLFNK